MRSSISLDNRGTTHSRMNKLLMLRTVMRLGKPAAGQAAPSTPCTTNDIANGNMRCSVKETTPAGNDTAGSTVRAAVLCHFPELDLCRFALWALAGGLFDRVLFLQQK